ncbi:hypothetical protein BD289DRAFT_74954 [Coniella lustricola]|uniref:Uncharacterized protein n=1 Tax=Coniella lustricola TaxID=2025994 RepID=A0A2T3AHW1_9PEZI|nr:hypothetical protein BD289DRAFT_74954 [Coniella lustricola]
MRSLPHLEGKCLYANELGYMSTRHRCNKQHRQWSRLSGLDHGCISGPGWLQCCQLSSASASALRVDLPRTPRWCQQADCTLGLTAVASILSTRKKTRGRTTRRRGNDRQMKRSICEIPTCTSIPAGFLPPSLPLSLSSSRSLARSSRNKRLACSVRQLVATFVTALYIRLLFR